MAERHATIVTDLGFGDAGKGTIVDYLARQGRVAAVVRFNGGAQARHSVVTPDGRHHAFSQFGSGSFVPGVRTHLSRFMLFDPEQLLVEASELRMVGIASPLVRLSVDEHATVVTPYHRAANMVREEMRGGARHGTCGHGIGEAMAHAIAHPDEVIRAGDLLDMVRLRRLIGRVRDRYADEFGSDNPVVTQYFSAIDTEVWCELVSSPYIIDQIVSASYLAQLSQEGNLVFEGAQGVLLDEWYGFHPHTTWSTTTAANAQTLLREIGFAGETLRLGALRTYMTRHGQGPFVTEDPTLTAVLPEPHNGEDGPQGAFRRGWFDAVMYRYALAASGGVDVLALTHVDRLAVLPVNQMATGYRWSLGETFREEWQTIARVHEQNGELLTRDLRLKAELTDLCYQKTMTSLLNTAQPVYSRYDDQRRFLEAVQEELRAPIGITSAGPTSGDKVWWGIKGI